MRYPAYNVLLYDIVAMVVDPLRAWRDLKETQRKQALAYNPKYIQLSLFDDL